MSNVCEEPAPKKPKNSTCLRTKFAQTLDDMKNSPRNLTPVLRANLVNECAITSFFVAKMVDKREISTAIADLAEKLPMGEYNHLKRVRKDEILLCPCDFMSLEALKVKLIDFGLEALSEDIGTITVAAESPVLKWQNDRAQKLWPCNFHPNKYLEKFASGAFFDDGQVRKHRTYMRMAYEVGLMNVDSLDDRLEDLKGAVVVDPVVDSVVAVGYDRRSKNPCQHQAMLAIDNVAKTQNGGAWREDDEVVGECSGIPDRILGHLRSTFGEAKFGARASKSDEQHEIDAPYICTGYEVYVTNEPCIMCSMALVHARVTRVFFAKPNLINGGVATKCKLHDAKDLNHHYDVFTGFFET